MHVSRRESRTPAPQCSAIRFIAAPLALDDSTGSQGTRGLTHTASFDWRIVRVCGVGCGLSGVAHDVDGVSRGERCLPWITVVVIVEIRTPASFLGATDMASPYWWLDLLMISIGRAAAGDLTELIPRTCLMLGTDYTPAGTRSQARPAAGSPNGFWICAAVHCCQTRNMIETPDTGFVAEATRTLAVYWMVTAFVW
jgi:hypothetical protein